MNNKQEILQLLRGEKDGWEKLLASLSETQIAAPDLPDHWSIKDIMAHLMAWQQVTNARMDAALSGGQPLFPQWFVPDRDEAEGQPHQANAHIFSIYREQPWDAVFRGWRSGFQKVLDSGEAIPEQDLLQAGKYAWMGPYALADVLLGTYGHHAEHMDTLTAWLGAHRSP